MRLLRVILRIATFSCVCFRQSITKNLTTVVWNCDTPKKGNRFMSPPDSQKDFSVLKSRYASYRDTLRVLSNLESSLVSCWSALHLILRVVCFHPGGENCNPKKQIPCWPGETDNLMPKEAALPQGIRDILHAGFGFALE